MLEIFGIDPIAESVYLAMLAEPNLGALELAARLGQNEDVIRAAFDELAGLALLRPSWDNPLLLRPVSPEVGLESLLARQQTDMVARQHQMDQGRAAMALLVASLPVEHSVPARSDVEELTGLDQVRDRLEQLTIHTRFEVLTLAPGGAQTDGARDASRPLDQQLLDRGIDVRTVYLDSAHNDPATSTYARWLTGLGGQVRTAPTLPLRMIIVDRETAVVPLNPRRSAAGAALLHSPGAVAAMCALFDQIWTVATPLGVLNPRDEQGLSSQEHVILRLMAQGDTDETIARKLAVSDRTVRRLISVLTAQLGARSRFQAGVRATERGWLGNATTPTVLSTLINCPVVTV